MTTPGPSFTSSRAAHRHLSGPKAAPWPTRSGCGHEIPAGAPHRLITEPTADGHRQAVICEPCAQQVMREERADG